MTAIGRGRRGPSRPPVRKPRPSHARRTARLRTSAVLAVVVVFAAARTAVALQLESEDGLNTSTVASAERNDTYDSAKQHGARQVKDLDRREFEPKGVRLGNFMFFPSVGTLVRYDDNLFGRATGAVADVRSEVTPQLLIKSSMPRHSLRVLLKGNIVNYAEHDDLDYASGSARIGGALHFDHAHTLSTELLTAREYGEPSDPTAPRAAALPIAVFHNRASIGITRDVGRLYGTFSVTAESWDYADTRDKDGNHIEQDMRDAQGLRGQLRAGYRFSPGYEVQTKLRALRTWNKGIGEEDRNSVGYEALIGLQGEINPLFTWRILGGIGVVDYDRPEFGTVTTSLLEARLSWLPTQFLTLHAYAERAVGEVLDGDGELVINSNVGVKADYEVWHNVVLNAGAELQRLEMTNGNADHVITGRFGVEYYASKNWLFTFGYEYQQALSTNADREMSRNRVRLGAKLQF